MKMKKLSALLALVSPLALGSAGTPAVAPPVPLPSPATVMAWNVYPGLDDPSPVINALASGDAYALMTEVEALWQQVRATDFPTRSTAIASQIAERRPLLVVLGEAALWRSQDPSDFDPTPNAATLEYDFLELLLSDLQARGLHYEPVAVSTNLDMELPRWNDGAPVDVRWTDRDVLLASTDVPSWVLRVGETANGNFETSIDLGGGLVVPRGWVSADVRILGHPLRVVGAHIEDMNEIVRDAQAAELLAGPAGGSGPLVLTGDFNSNALDPAASTYALFMQAGLRDAWVEAHPHQAGATCCQDPSLMNVASLLDERLDLVLLRGGMRVADVVLSGDKPGDRVTGLWPSDHAGISTTLGH